MLRRAGRALVASHPRPARVRHHRRRSKVQPRTDTRGDVLSLARVRPPSVRLGAEPKHCAALGASVKCEGAARAGAAIADRARADAGDGDESASWARGDARASVHDGRTGGPVGGGGPIPASRRKRCGASSKRSSRVLCAARRDVADVPVAAVEARTAAEAKRLAARYAAAKHAMVRGRARESALARWREGY